MLALGNTTAVLGSFRKFVLLEQMDLQCGFSEGQRCCG